MRRSGMTSSHTYHSHRPSLLEIKQLAEFDASLGNETEDEKRRKRIAYLKDAANQAKMGASMLKGFGCFVIPFAIIPVFWPFLIFFWFMRKKALGLMDSQLDLALSYWEIRRDEVITEDRSTR
jgi:hypothetical protein